MSRSTIDAGNAGEAYVAGRLEREGYRIVARNWRVRGGELDIVALDGDVLVCIEVRVRTGERVVRAEETVDGRKLRRVLLAAELFVEAHPEFHDSIWRVDVVAVTLSRAGAIERYLHLKNVTLE